MNWRFKLYIILCMTYFLKLNAVHLGIFETVAQPELYPQRNQKTRESCLSASPHQHTAIRIATFNIWKSGTKVNNGMQKIVAQILKLNPDVVGIQEIGSVEIFEDMLQALGPEWTGVTTPANYSDVGIISRHLINTESVVTIDGACAIGADIVLNSGQTISFWCLHLDHLSYGPYAAHFKLTPNLETILRGEKPEFRKGRANQILELINTPAFRDQSTAAVAASGNPLIVVGDFNSPSHLDWISETSHMHGNWTIQWPATYLLQSETNLIDSYRKLHSDPLKQPGITWSSVQTAWSIGEGNYEIPEPFDRIDFIFYKSPCLLPVSSFTWQGTEVPKAIPNHMDNEWPSDHFAVVTDFTLATYLLRTSPQGHRGRFRALPPLYAGSIRSTRCSTRRKPDHSNDGKKKSRPKRIETFTPTWTSFVPPNIWSNDN